MMLIRFLILSLFCLNGLNAQEYQELFYQSSKGSSALPFHLKTQVQSLEDFIARFNGYHNAYGDSIDTNSPKFRTIHSNSKYWKTWRTKIIGSLLSQELMKRDSINGWPALQKLVSINEIDLNTSSMVACLPVNIHQNGKTTIMIIELIYIELDGNRYEWMINRVFDPNVSTTRKGQKPSLSDLQGNSEKYLPPNAHGNGFIKLQRTLQKEKGMNSLVCHNIEGLDAFNKLLAKATSISFDPVYFVFFGENSHSFKVDDNFYISSFQNY